jgi:hypothetical protein
MKYNPWKNNPNFVKEVPRIHVSVFVIVIMVSEKKNRVLLSCLPPLPYFPGRLTYANTNYYVSMYYCDHM